MAGMNSAVYTGEVRHRRFTPKSHEFNYPIFMLYLDLDELPQLFNKKWYASMARFNFLSFRREDYFSPESTSLKSSVIDEVRKQLGAQLEVASVRMLCHVRYANYVFNPVVFYYCFSEDDQLVAILAEITNTPWGERHHYVLPVASQARCADIEHVERGAGRHQFQFSKAFHVSPFNPMNMDYRWVFSVPEQALHVHMDNYMGANSNDDSDGGMSPEKHFDATLTLHRRSIENELGRTLIQFPFMTVKVVSGIYWQAFKLWCKRVPFYDHPSI